MPTQSIKELKQTANNLRQDVIRMLAQAASGHPAGSLGMADIFAALYFNILNYIPNKPHWHLRDRLVLSNGHICPILYASLSRAGYFPLVKLKSLRKINSSLQGHPHNLSTPGVEVSAGPLGQGISQAVGMALAGQHDKHDYHIFCITSDAEHDEGQLWEAVLMAKKYKLGNLINIIDRNRIQIDGFTRNIMPTESLRSKYIAFGWRVLEMDGHNLRQIIHTIHKAKKYHQSPVAIIAHTIPGKGVSFMENDWHWHGTAPDKKQAEKALDQLKHQKI